MPFWMQGEHLTILQHRPQVYSTLRPPTPLALYVVKDNLLVLSIMGKNTQHLNSGIETTQASTKWLKSAHGNAQVSTPFVMLISNANAQGLDT